ncbi:hypothetical protein BDZ94DRAFT_1195932 [Collybia nuda]|uniref:Uncharacterized protein n=1 Tax=Collybia nuda TaxID=64659 RepID=A0A9P5Y3K8_9AGAR|nr:hypothetical protein BDZ94DRAFT_1195932 [Collybia nuda]
MPQTMLFCILGLSIASLVYASPLPNHNHIPVDASHLAIDSRSGHIIAFHSSGKRLGTFPMAQGNSSDLVPRDGTGSCSPLSLDDAKKLPGWGQLEAAAKKNWGGGSYNLAVNPPEYKDQPATVCSSNAATLKLSGKPSCHTQKQSTDGKLANSSGTVSLASTEGTQLKQQTSVTKESSIGAGMSITATIGIPEVAGVSAEMSTSVSVSNSLTKSFESTADTSQTQSVTMNAKTGETCHLEFNSKTCDYSGTGSINVIASGFVWFNFNDKTNGHYKWALKIDDVLPDIKDRSSSVDFQASGNMITKSDYQGKCAK